MSAIEGQKTDLDLWWSEIWERLAEGARLVPPRDPQHKTAFRHPAAATVSDGEPVVRTVILRHADASTRTLRFHTDLRAPKVEHLRSNPAIGLLFYDAVWQLQVRIKATARLHHQDELAWMVWKNTQLLSRRCYSSVLAPGTPVEGPTSGLPEPLETREPTPKESEAGWGNFAVVSCEVHDLEAMSLAFSGHKKAAWRWDGQNWMGQWLVP